MQSPFAGFVSVRAVTEKELPGQLHTHLIISIKPHPHHTHKVKVKSLSRVCLFATPWTAAHQAPLSVGFSRQEYRSGLPFPSLRASLASAGGFFTIAPPGNRLCISKGYLWRRQWHPTPALLPGKSHGWRSLVGCSPWGC